MTEWIDCEKQMPEPGVLVIGYGQRLNGNRGDNGYEFVVWDRMGWGWESEHINPTHWMSIPSPPLRTSGDE